VSSDKRFATIAPQQAGGVLTTTYGSEASDWTTKAIDVSQFDYVQFKFDYSNHSVGALLTLKPMFGDRDSANLDAYVDTYFDSGAGVLTLLELSKTTPGNLSGALPPMDVRGISLLRIAAKIDNAAGGPVLALTYLGHRAANQPAQETSPVIT